MARSGGIAVAHVGTKGSTKNNTQAEVDLWDGLQEFITNTDVLVVKTAFHK